MLVVYTCIHGCVHVPGFSDCLLLLCSVQVRMVPARPGIAFVEFDSEMQATAAMTGLQNFRITPEKAMQIVYAK